MARKNPKKQPPSKARPDPLRGLDAQQRVDLLARLLGDHPELREEAAHHTSTILAEITVEQVAEDVRLAIEYCDVDQLYANSGPSSYGYEEPREVAGDMLDACVQPSMDLIAERLELGRDAEAAIVCQGILLGLYEHRHGWPTTDKVLGFDGDFPSRAADEAIRCYRQGRGPGKKEPKPLPASFWEQVPDWSGLGEGW